MFRFIYNKKTYLSYHQLLFDLVESEEGVASLKNVTFPLDYEVYICALLNQKFPDSKLTVEDVKKILAEELALKNITMKSKKGSERQPSC